MAGMNIYSAGSGTIPTPLYDTKGRLSWVSLQNTGTATVWISDNQGALLASVDANGLPHQGFVLAPNSAPFVMITKGALFAFAQGAGGQIEVKGEPLC